MNKGPYNREEPWWEKELGNRAAKIMGLILSISLATITAALILKAL